MALAEGLATLYDLSGEQRKMLIDGVKSAASQFNRRTLQSARLNQGESKKTNYHSKKSVVNLNNFTFCKSTNARYLYVI